MEYQNTTLEMELLRKRHEQELLKEALKDAKEKDEKLAKEPLLSLEEVTEQMATGMVHYPDLPIRFRVVRFFGGRLSLPLPVDYLNRHTTQKELAVLVNDTMGISLTLQLTKSLKKNVTFDEVKCQMVGQFKGAGIYIELLEEGSVEDDFAPTHFITYRMPMAKGVMYHMVFYAINRIDGSMVIGDYNCFYKDIEKWENIIKATVSYMDFK